MMMCNIEVMVVELSAANKGNSPVQQIQRLRNAIWKGVKA
jgi:hypothetical protein